MTTVPADPWAEFRVKPAAAPAPPPAEADPWAEFRVPGGGNGPLTWTQATGQAVVSAPSSAAGVVGNFAHMVAHPIETAGNFADLGAGAIREGAKRVLPESVVKAIDATGTDATNQRIETAAQNAGRFYADRLGSVEAIKRTLATDPVGLAVDVSALLTGGGSLAARLPGVAGRAGEAAVAAGRAIDPIQHGLNAAVKTGKALTRSGSLEAAADIATSNEAVRAAQSIGVDVPKVAAGTPNGVRMTVGAGLKEVPVVGAPIVKAADAARDQMLSAASRIAEDYAKGATPATAGAMAKQGLADWIKKGSAEALTSLYDKIGDMIPATASRPLANTREAAKVLREADTAAASTVNAPAVAMIEDAIARPEGLTYRGLQQLRTNVGNMIDDNLLPGAGTMKPALKQIYGALTRDLQDTVEAFGGRQAKKAWLDANRATNIVQAKREQLQKIIGASGDMSAESVLDRLVAKAGSTSTADVRGLSRAMSVLPAEARAEVAAAAVGRLGRDQSNVFNPTIFLRKYTALTDNGRNLLFMGKENAALKGQLDALARTAEAFRNLNRLSNTSGTARASMVGHAILAGAGGAISYLNPVTLPFTLFNGIAGRTLASAMAKPQVVREMNRTMQGLYRMIDKGEGVNVTKLSLLMLAKHLADATGEDEGKVGDTLQRNLASLIQPASFDPGAGGPPQGGPPVAPQGGDPTVVKRGMVLPLAEMSDGSVQPAVPGLIQGPFDSFKRLLAADPGQPFTQDMAGDALAVAGAALPATAFGRMTAIGKPLAAAEAETTSRAAPAVQETVRAAPEASPVADAVVAAPARPQSGGPVEIVTPDQSMTISATPQVVELDSLKAAKGALQPRDRTRAEYMQEARSRAARLDPQQLQPARVSDSGAPIVLADGTVISGNGRTMSIAEVYDNPALKAQAEAYRASLGPAAAGMREPVLVMRADMAAEDAARFADLSNRSRIAAMGATERAQRDAKALGDLVGLYQGGDFEAANNADFVRAFMSKVVTDAERSGLSKDAQLTQEGLQRMRGAVLASAYDDAPTLTRMLESTDDNIRSLTGALTDAAPKFSALRADIAAGRVSPDMDATGAITDAVKLIADLRSRNRRPADFFAQTDAFGGVPAITEAWVRAFYNDDLSRAISREKMTAVLRAYADEAAKHQPGGLFADPTTTKDVLDVAARAKSSVGQGNGEGLRLGGEAVSGRTPSDGGRGPQRESGVPGDGGSAAPWNRSAGEVSPKRAAQLARIEEQKRRRAVA